MSKSTREITKSRRPAGTGEPVLVRLQPELANQLDTLRSLKRPIPTRAEAIRQLIAAAFEAVDDKDKV